MAFTLLRLLATGAMAATQVQAIAAAAWEDRWARDNDMADALASAGFGGRNPSNILRDVLRAAKNCGLMDRMAQPYIFDAPGPRRGQTVPVRVFLPHEALHYAVADGVAPWCLNPTEMNSDIGVGKLLRDWGARPDVRDDHRLAETSVLGLRADGVAYNANTRAGASKGALVGSFNVISAQTPALRAKRTLLFAIAKHNLCNCGRSGFHTTQAPEW